MTTTRPLIVGEVLFDHFPDGHRVLGGAPFNVAWNLRGLGRDPLFVSAIGDDEPGREVVSRMEAWGLDTSGIQRGGNRPTGKVRVELDEGQPTFDILDEQAYDEIRFPSFAISTDEFSLLYVGSLAYRHEPTRSTVRRLIDEGLDRFVDVNIRRPWFDREWIPVLFGGAKWIKLNDQELAWIAEADDCSGADGIGAAVRRTRRRYGGGRYLITCGARGAYSVDESGEVDFVAAPEPERMKDTVGAGDAFAAATIHGLLDSLPLDRILRSAASFASRACAIRGATTTDRGHYADF